MKKKRNNTIDILKFVFAICIVIHHICKKFHIPFFQRGLLAVDFYFIVSGYLFLKSIRKRRKNGTENVYQDNVSFIPMFCLDLLAVFF